MSPRIYFEQELELLKGKVTEMGRRAEISYDRLVCAFRENDRETMKQLLDNDRQMMDMQRSIEAKCLTLITTQQPVARDLRLVSAALKVVTDIERVGEHVSDVAELCLRMKESTQKGIYESRLLAMMEGAKSMLQEAVAAFVEGNVKAAKQVVESDHAVNIGEWAVFQVTGDMQGVKLY